MNDREQIMGMHKGILWEEAKGKLRALNSVAGSGNDDMERFLNISTRIEDFIEEFESDGLHE